MKIFRQLKGWIPKGAVLVTVTLYLAFPSFLCCPFQTEAVAATLTVNTLAANLRQQ
jgi:hypothetical protein